MDGLNVVQSFWFLVFLSRHLLGYIFVPHGFTLDWASVWSRQQTAEIPRTAALHTPVVKCSQVYVWFECGQCENGLSIHGNLKKHIHFLLKFPEICAKSLKHT